MVNYRFATPRQFWFPACVTKLSLRADVRWNQVVWSARLLKVNRFFLAVFVNVPAIHYFGARKEIACRLVRRWTELGISGQRDFFILAVAQWLEL